ncbi:MAG TPA: alpha-amylase family glycosyl hydrolase [Verrucomicrobiae bacterium]|nr:alpha-amylase family glycosyl hydrolase [Verrucomicrobiae bacterium]
MRTSSRNILRLLTGIALLWQLALVAENPSQVQARTSSAWLHDGVIYEIFPRDFSPSGNLNGVTARLDELKDLGVTVLWIMPIHPIGEKLRKGEFGSPYSVRDYYAVNPDYGTLDDFKRLVAEAHKRNLKVIMDLVANHTAWDSVMMTHPEFYKQNKDGQIVPPVEEWTDVAGLNYQNPRLREYMIGVMKYWMQTSDIDGFRCDVASMVPIDFWEVARAQLETIKPDIMLLAEASKPELLTNAFDVDYDWPLMGALNDVLCKDAPASKLQAVWEEDCREFPRDALHMRISDDHDEPRAVSRFGARGALAASALMFTLDGVPLLYNGMEAGDATESGDPALFDKLPIQWSPKGRPPMREIYRDLIRLRKEYAPLRNGRVLWLHNSKEESVVTYERTDENKDFVIVINFSNRPIHARVDVNNGEDFAPVRIAGTPAAPAGDFPSVHMGGFEWRIYQRSSHSADRAAAGRGQLQIDAVPH